MTIPRVSAERTFLDFLDVDADDGALVVETGGDLGHPAEHLVHHRLDVAELPLHDGQEQRVEELVDGPPEAGKKKKLRCRKKKSPGCDCENAFFLRSAYVFLSWAADATSEKRLHATPSNML